MIFISSFSITTGEVISSHSFSDPSLMDLPDDDCEHLVGMYDYEEWYRANGEFVQKPAKPSSTHVWNETTKEWELSLDILNCSARAKRSSLLVSSDWTDTLSFKNRVGEAKYNEWQSYRQALRDITNQEGYPINIEWPVLPN